MSNSRNLTKHQPPFTNHQSGQSTVYIILIVIVIIFAVMFAGGGNSLFTGNEPSSVTDAPTPTPDPLATTTPGTTTTPNASWSLDIVEGTCQSGKSSYKQENISAKGSADGTITLEIENPIGTWKIDAAIPFHTPAENYSVKLDNATGYNIKNWRIKLSSGGVEQAAKTGSPTGC